MIRNSSVKWAVAVTSLLIAAGCGGGSSSPSAPAVTITVNSTSATPDTLFAATRTRQFSAVASQGGTPLATQPAFTWSSLTPAVATVDASTGLVTAVNDGVATIQASASGTFGARSIVVRRLMATHSLSPSSDSITTSGGTTGTFTGAASDSSGAPITIHWASRNTNILTVNPTSGTTTTGVAAGNGTTQLLMVVAGATVDSASVKVSGQPIPPASASVTIGDDFFRSVHNNTSNEAVDTIAVNGTVTWTWSGASSHSVASTGSPSFTSSTIKTSGTYQVTFPNAGTYTYDCAVHGAAMTGRIVVR